MGMLMALPWDSRCRKYSYGQRGPSIIMERLGQLPNYASVWDKYRLTYLLSMLSFKLRYSMRLLVFIFPYILWELKSC